MKTIFVSVFQEDALVIKSLLESGGIGATLLVDTMLDVNPFFYSDIHGVKIVVADEDEEAATALVRDYKSRKT
ncbi:MAG TPA: DUF2007 domain-containing protein [Rectinemataceae bacterium]